jgi:hypothetical protein
MSGTVIHARSALAARLGHALLAPALLGAALLAQDPDAKPDPELRDRLKELKAMVGDSKMEQDMQAIALIRVLAEKPEARNPKDYDAIAKALGDVFRTGKARPPEQDILYRETADALAGFGEEGARQLAKAIGNKRLEDSVSLQAHMLVAIGRTRDPKQVELLTETAVRSRHDELRAAAGEALGHYTDLDVKVRREVVKKLIREWGGLHQLATQRDNNDANAPIDLGPQNARRSLAVIQPKWNAALQKLTGVAHEQFPDWQHWLNKNPNWTPVESAPPPK